MAQVKFRRIEDSSDINDIPIVDGQLIYTKDGKEYIDYETDRIPMTAETSPNYVLLWQNPDDTQTFTPQSITFNEGDYDTILWIFRWGGDDTQKITFSNMSLKGYGVSVSKGNGYSRTIDYQNGSYYAQHCYDNNSNVADNFFMNYDE